MAEQDDDRRLPPTPRLTGDVYPERLRHVTAGELGDVRDRIHTVSNHVHAQTTNVALLQQRVDDHHEQLKANVTEHASLRADLEARVSDARKYAATIVREFKDELLELRREEKEERRHEANWAIAKAAIWATVGSAAAGVVVSIAVGFWGK